MTQITIDGKEINICQTPYAYILGKNYEWEAVLASHDGDEDAVVGYGSIPSEAVDNLLLNLGE